MVTDLEFQALKAEVEKLKQRIYPEGIPVDAPRDATKPVLDMDEIWRLLGGEDKPVADIDQMKTHLKLVDEPAPERLIAIMNGKPSQESVAARIAGLGRPCQVIDLDAYFDRILNGPAIAFPGSTLENLRNRLKRISDDFDWDRTPSSLSSTPCFRHQLKELATIDCPEIALLYRINNDELLDCDLLIVGDMSDASKRYLAVGIFDQLIKTASKSHDRQTLMWAEDRKTIERSAWLEFLENDQVPGIRLEIG